MSVNTQEERHQKLGHLIAQLKFTKFYLKKAQKDYWINNL